MKLSAPIYHLKRKAKLLSRQRGIPLHEALDRIAVEEGFRQWSLLSARASAASIASKLFTQFCPGDLALIGARPGHGKTLLSTQILVEAMRAGNRGVFFTLEYAEHHVKDLFRTIGVDVAEFKDRFELDTSDAISADFIIQRLASMPCGTVAVLDYLQLLDQRRDQPALSDQVRALKAFAHDRGLIIIFLSQIDRSYDASTQACPGLTDVRLPNPLDLTLFSKACFLHGGNAQFQVAR
jgi:replicative DNA helicase